MQKTQSTNIKKKDIKKCPQLTITTTAKKSNMFVVLSYNVNGLQYLIKRFSSGSCGGKGKTKVATYTLNVIMQNVLTYIKSYVKIDEGFNVIMTGRDESFRDLILQYRSELTLIAPILSVDSKHDAAHGGVKGRRARRV